VPIVETQVAKGTYSTPPSLFDVLSFDVVGGGIWGFFHVVSWEGGLILAALRFAVFMNLLVTGRPGWTAPSQEEGEFIFQAGGRSEL